MQLYAVTSSAMSPGCCRPQAMVLVMLSDAVLALCRYLGPCLAVCYQSVKDCGLITKCMFFGCLDMTAQTHNQILLVVSTKLASWTDQPGHPLPLSSRGYCTPGVPWCVGEETKQANNYRSKATVALIVVGLLQTLTCHLDHKRAFSDVGRHHVERQDSAPLHTVFVGFRFAVQAPCCS